MRRPALLVAAVVAVGLPAAGGCGVETEAEPVPLTTAAPVPTTTAPVPTTTLRPDVVPGPSDQDPAPLPAPPSLATPPAAPVPTAGP